MLFSALWNRHILLFFLIELVTLMIRDVVLKTTFFVNKNSDFGKKYTKM